MTLLTGQGQVKTALSQLAWFDWAYGLIWAIMSGGATSAGGVFVVIMVAPETFNFTKVGKLLTAAGGFFLVGGATNFFSYLKQHPLPERITAMTRDTETLLGTKVHEEKIVTEQVLPATTPPSVPNPVDGK